MMNSYRHSNPGGRRILYVVILVIVVFVIDGFTGGNIRSLVRFGASSVYGAGDRMGSAILQSGLLSTRRGLERENQALRDEITRLQMHAGEYEILKAENTSLRELVNLAEGESGITAPVVSSFRASPYGTFMIGAGSEDGVGEGSVVISGDPEFGGFVIGRVENVERGQSLVKGVFAPGETTEATIRGVGISVEGRGGGQARAEAPRDAEIVVGDLVITTAFGIRAIGIVGRVEESVGSASQLLYIHLPVPLTSLRFVYVLAE